MEDGDRSLRSGTARRMRKLIAALVGVAFASAGCATIFNGQTQIVHVETVPDACRVSVDGQSSQLSPCSFPVKRGQEHTLRIEKDGYRSDTLIIEIAKSFPFQYRRNQPVQLTRSSP